MAIPRSALADTAAKQYTDILTDLSVDESFDISQYPEKDGDYSIDIFQIAESTDNELFVYCYTPCRTFTRSDGTEIELKPTQISIAVSTDLEKLSYVLHGLTEVHRYKTLTKYVVNGVEVDTTPTTRYYSVPMLQRKNTDDEEEAAEVGKLWTVQNTETGVQYTETHKQTILIQEPIAGVVRYKKDPIPAFFGKNGMDNHFVAFDTDLPIDDLLEADVSYMTVAVGGDLADNGTYISWSEVLSIIESYGDGALDNELMAKALRDYAIENNFYDTGSVTVKKNQKYTFSTDGWFGEDKYSWNRIMRMRDFNTTMENGEVHSISGAYSTLELLSRKWVLCYRETTYAQNGGWFDTDLGGYWFDFDIVVLRLKFETNGVVYDLGTVSNKVNQTEFIQGNDPKDVFDILQDVIDWIIDHWYLIVIGIVAVIAIIVLAPFMPTILSGIVSLLKLIGKFLLWVLKGLWWLVSAPFRLIIRLFKGGDSA